MFWKKKKEDEGGSCSVNVRLLYADLLDILNRELPVFLDSVFSSFFFSLLCCILVKSGIKGLSNFNLICARILLLLELQKAVSNANLEEHILGRVLEVSLKLRLVLNSWRRKDNASSAL